MAWTTPKTNWATGELVTAQDMNAVGENLAELGNLRSAVAVYTTTEDIRANASGFVNVDDKNLNLTISTAGGDVLVHFSGSVIRYGSNDLTGYLDIEVDGNRQGGNTGILRAWFSNRTAVASFTRLIRNLSPGSHSFKLQWKGYGIRLYSGAQFWVREI